MSLDFLDPSDHWDRLTLLIWQAAQDRHGGSLRLVPKDSSTLFHVLAFLLKVVTLGKGADLINSLHTTLGSTIYLAGDGSSFQTMDPMKRFSLLSHEIAHADDFVLGDAYIREAAEVLLDRTWIERFFYKWVRGPLLAAGYLITPLPFRYALIRQAVEEAGFYREAEVLAVHYVGEVPNGHRMYFRRLFTGKSYAWMSTQEHAEKVVDRMCTRALLAYARGDLDWMKPPDDIGVAIEFPITLVP